MVAIVEYWHAFARQRKDLFGCFDLLGIGEGGTIAVQTTSASNVAARVHKLTDSPALAFARKAGWQLYVHGWSKGDDGKWRCREVDLS